MIRTFKDKNVRKLYEEGDRKGINQSEVVRLERALAILDQASDVRSIDTPGYRVHPLKGNREGQWSISVTGNMRLVFKFENGDAYDVEYIDYH